MAEDVIKTAEIIKNYRPRIFMSREFEEGLKSSEPSVKRAVIKTVAGEIAKTYRILDGMEAVKDDDGRLGSAFAHKFR